jgi:hypothetical protein
MMVGGWKDMLNKEGDLSHLGEPFDIDLKSDFLPKTGDTVISLHFLQEKGNGSISLVSDQYLERLRSYKGQGNIRKQFDCNSFRPQY